MYLGKNRRYKFYSEEVDLCPPRKLRRIAEACKKVEDRVWNAHEDFYSYVQKQSALLYAKHDDEVVGFALFDLYLQEDSLIVAANECMIVPEHHGQNLVNIFSAILVNHIRRDRRLRGLKRDYSSLTFVSTTVNFKLMEAFRRYSYLSDKSTFKVDQHILHVAQKYRQDHGLEALSENLPFFLKGTFPNSTKLPMALSAPEFVPQEFNLERGDCFLFVCRISRFWLLAIISFYTCWKTGFRFSNRILFISRIYRQHAIYTRKV